MGHSTSNKTIKPYGSWPSTITSEQIVADSIGLDEIQVCGDKLFWIEKHPQESGRCTVMCLVDNKHIEITPPPYNCRSRVHEYGGGSYIATEIGIFFVNNTDQNIYLAGVNNEVSQITHTENFRYADMVFDNQRDHIICVCENHTGKGEPTNTIASVAIYTGEISTLVEGSDFYSNPKLNPDSTKLCWLCWYHPNMPWDGTDLYIADISYTGALSGHHHIAGSQSISVFQPQWSPDNILHYVSDESGWWNIYRYDKTIEPITQKEYEFGLPQWVFAQSTYSFVNKNTIVCAFTDNGKCQIALLSTQSKNLDIIDTPGSNYYSIQASSDHLYFIASSVTQSPQIVSHLLEDKTRHLVTSSTKFLVDATNTSIAQNMQFKTRHNDIVFANYYPPANKTYGAPETEKPPLIVITHGGPTAFNSDAFDIKKQFWTSRGFAMLDVNYSGSTGYGREYRERLNFNWGKRDVEDCCDAALYVAEQGLADKDRLIIKGGSAGGYTVLSALTFHDVFSAGASYYGIGELEALAKDTHKFESRYLDNLIGPYPEKKETYYKRSPINYVNQLNCPVIFFQGTEDKVVPKEQAESMFNALKEKGLPVSYLPFEGEQHGFRNAETIKRCLDAELAFYQVIFGIDPSKTSELTIENLQAAQA